MAFDPSIISSIPDSLPKPVESLQKAATLKDMLDREQLTRLQTDTAQREAKERTQVDEILKSSDYSTPEGLAATAAKVNKVSPRSAMDLMKEGQAYQSGQIKNQLDQLSLASQRQDLIVGAIDPIVAQARAMKNGGASDLAVKAFITQQMPQALEQLRGMKLGDGNPALPDDVLKMATSVPGGYTLETLEGWEGRSKAGAAALKQRLEQFKADTQERRLDETERHDRATEAAAQRRLQSGEFTDDQRSLLAEMAIRNVNLPAGLRSQAQIRATLDGLISKNPKKSMGEIADDIRSGRLKLTAETSAARTAGTQIGRVSLAGNELDTFGDQTLEASKAVPRGVWGLNKSMTINGLIQLGEKEVSDPKLLRLKTKLVALNNAYDQLAARGGTDVEKRAHVRELFTAKLSDEAVQTLVQSLKEEAAGAREAANRTIAETSDTAIPGTDSTASTNPVAPGAAPAQALSPQAAPGQGAAPGSNPPPAKTAPATGALQPGKKYQHESGATVEILD